MSAISAPRSPNEEPIIRKTPLWKTLLNQLGTVIGLVFVFGLFSILRPDTFFNMSNVELILVQSAVVGMSALGMTIIIIAGGIDLSVGSNIALGTVTIALLLNDNFPPLLAALGGVAAGAACGLIISFFVTELNLSSFIVTLGMWGAVRGVAKGLAHDNTVIPPETWLNNLLNMLSRHQRWMIFPVGVWMMLFCAVLVSLLLKYTRVGKHIFAIGSNEQTARLCGVPINRTKIIIYTLGAALTGLAGVLQFSYLTIGDPTTANGLELNIIAAVVIGGGSLSGGQGSVFGSLVGALIMTTISIGCTKLGLSNWVQEIVTGFIIILAVTLDQIRHRRRV